MWASARRVWITNMCGKVWVKMRQRNVKREQKRSNGEMEEEEEVTATTRFLFILFLTLCLLFSLALLLLLFWFGAAGMNGPTDEWMGTERDGARSQEWEKSYYYPSECAYTYWVRSIKMTIKMWLKHPRKPGIIFAPPNLQRMRPTRAMESLRSVYTLNSVNTMFEACFLLYALCKMCTFLI